MNNIEQYIEEQLQNIDIRSIVVQEVRTKISTEIHATIVRLTEQEVTSIIKREIEISLNEPVKTDDGWGNRAEYGSFNVLFRKIFAERLNGCWDMKQMLKKAVEARVTKLYEANKKEAIEKIAKEITKE